MTRTITRDDLLNEITNLDLSRRNPQCVYTAPDGTHCIAGQLLVNLNVNVPDDSTRDERFSYMDLNARGIRALIEDGWFRTQDVEFDEDATTFLDAVQLKADGYHNPDAENGMNAKRVTWEYAVIETKEDLGIT